MKIKTLFQEYPLATYFILAYLISWGGSIAFGGPQFIRSEPMELQETLNMALFVLAGPLIAGLLSTSILEGKDGLQSLFSRMFKWRISIGWYAAALLIFPVLILAVLLSLSIFLSSDFSPNFVSFGILGGLIAGFIEETGWTGYAYPRMQSKYGALRATFYLALLHGIWHAVPGILGDYLIYETYWLPRFIVMWMVAMVAMRVILVWIYTNTGSLLLAQLTHASSTGFLLIFGPSPISPANEVLWWAIYAVVIWLAAASILARYGKQLVRQPKQAAAI